MHASLIKSFFKIMLITIVLLLYFQPPVYAENITLAWDANTESDLDHYVIYWGTSSENYTDNSENHGIFIGRNDTTCTILDLDTSQYTYYFVATAVNSAGLESDYSNEVNTSD